MSPPLSRRALILAAAAAGLAPASAAGGEPSSGDAKLDALFDAFVEDLLNESPESATSLGLDTGARAALKSRLSDRSISGAQADATATAWRLNLLEAFDTKGLNTEARLNYDVTLYAHRLGAGGAAFAYGDNSLAAAMGESATPYVVSQQGGAFTSVPDLLDNQHTVETTADAEAWLARLEAFALQVDQESERVRRDARLGVVPPTYLLATTLDELGNSRATPADQSRLSVSLGRKVTAAGLDGDWAARAAVLVTGKVYPSLDRQIETLKALRPNSTAEAGVWRLPDGEAYYAWLLKVGTSTAKTPDEVYRLGLEQVAELTDRLDILLKAQGLTQGAVGARLAALSKDPRFVFPNDDTGRAQIVDYLNSRIDAVRQRLPLAFNTTNKGAVIVKRVPPEIEAGAGLGYMAGGSLDGSRPGIYYINLADTSVWPKWTLPTLTYHETLPGHVWQGAYVAERNSLPMIDNFWGFNAYVEGWALYAEQLADELGLYDDDPFGRIGYLQSIQFRACRLVVDTGLHARRWGRDQAIAWLDGHNGCGHFEAQNEIDRYIAGPGQACGYKIGHSEFNRQRDRARRALGPRFDLRAFDDAVLLCGGVPLELLGGVVDRYIAAARAGG